MATENLPSRVESNEAKAASAGALVPAESSELMAQVFGDLGAPTFHNFTGDKMAVWRQLAKWTAVECLSATDVGNAPIALRHFIVHQVQLAGDTPGEVIDALRVVIVPPSGEAVAFVSDGIARDIARIVQTFGTGPYEPPIMVAIASVRTRKGRTTLRLVPAE